jgi:SAM-dependent methyltransferase
MSQNLVINFPPVDKEQSPPIWTGENFMVNGNAQSILDYLPSDNTGWTSEVVDNVLINMYEKGVIGLESQQNALNEIRHNFKSEDKFTIMEIGCFQGAFLEAIKKEFPFADIVGAEYDRGSLEYISRKKLKIPLLRFDLVKSPLHDSTFDVIVVLNVIEHIKDDNEAIAQCYRMLKPSGVLILEVPAGENLYDSFDKYVGHYRRYNINNLEKLLEENKFYILTRSHLVFMAYPLFWISKIINKKKNISKEIGKKIVRDRVLIANKNYLLKLSLIVDQVIRRFCYIPYGVRCVLTSKK